ncbi:hypothetical protein L6452_27463 [Arctium lappa]|uniref:Uncharacterized protein n=1 Tax=Arctium lappa TaxID=4217 RepID=A0ACB9A0M9_ARCLA|nr:hypothetical protein L6452_27463 [Arctium lappa]
MLRSYEDIPRIIDAPTGPECVMQYLKILEEEFSHGNGDRGGSNTAVDLHDVDVDIEIDLEESSDDNDGADDDVALIPPHIGSHPSFFDDILSHEDIYAVDVDLDGILRKQIEAPSDVVTRLEFWEFKDEIR